ncbi:hypothetical protein FOA52_011912 [Chlamydomonas sp. UWO 241]|nr:hypothetical protein FOA52_011912 [Chlamydomonas sp. UWO 241]
MDAAYLKLKQQFVREETARLRAEQEVARLLDELTRERERPMAAAANADVTGALSPHAPIPDANGASSTDAPRAPSPGRAGPHVTRALSPHAPSPDANGVRDVNGAPSPDANSAPTPDVNGTPPPKDVTNTDVASGAATYEQRLEARDAERKAATAAAAEKRKAKTTPGAKKKKCARIEGEDGERRQPERVRIAPTDDDSDAERTDADADTNTDDVTTSDIIVLNDDTMIVAKGGREAPVTGQRHQGAR